MPNDNDICFLLFAKSPDPGRVKTRLAAKVGMTAAAELYKCFVEETAGLLKKLGLDFRLYFWPPETKDIFIAWLGSDINYLPQSGNDLGQKLKNAFEDTFNNGYKSVIAIGSDSPDLSMDFLKQARSALVSHDAVIGPASDGGYYLIGFNKDSFATEVFDEINWSTNSVLEKTINKFNSMKINFFELPKWHDIDNLADLKLLIKRNKNTAFKTSKTYLHAAKILETTNV